MRILALGAHHDDLELGCGGTLNKLSKQGHKVYTYTATDSEFKSHTGQLVRNKNHIYEEQKKASAILGVEKFFNGSFKIHELSNNDLLRKELLLLADKVNPDLIFTHWHEDIHHDHRELSIASITALKHVKNILMYQSNYYKSFGCFNPNIYVDITNSFQQKVEAFRCYKSEYERRGKLWLSQIDASSKINGTNAQAERAEAFLALKYNLFET